MKVAMMEGSEAAVAHVEKEATLEAWEVAMAAVETMVAMAGREGAEAVVAATADAEEMAVTQEGVAPREEH